MSTSIIAYFGIAVFVLMSIGIILTMLEFTKLTEEPSQKKDSPEPLAERETYAKADIRVVANGDDAA